MPAPESTPGPTPGPEQARRHRKKLRQAGLREVQLWVPDTRVPGFAAEVLSWIEASSDTTGWR